MKTITIDEMLYIQLDREAKKKGMSINDYIAYLLDQLSH